MIAKVRLAPLGARTHGFLEVLGRESDVELRVALVIHVGMEPPGIEARPQQLLCELYADAAVADDPLGERVAAVEERLGLGDAGNKANAIRFLGVDVAPRKHDFECARRANRTGQKIRESEFRSGEAVVDAGRAKIGLAGGDADVARRRQAEPPPRSRHR